MTMSINIPGGLPRARVRSQTVSGIVAMIIGIGLLAALVAMPWWAGQGTIRSVVELCCYIAIAQMWNLLAGYGGLVSVGQQAFSGVAAYMMFALAQNMGVNPFVAVPLCLIAPAILAVPTYALLQSPRWPVFRHRDLGRGRGRPASDDQFQLCERRRGHEPAGYDAVQRARTRHRRDHPVRSHAARHSGRDLLAAPVALRTGADGDAGQSGFRGKSGRERVAAAVPAIRRRRGWHRARRGDLLHGATSDHARLRLRSAMGRQ